MKLEQTIDITLRDMFENIGVEDFLKIIATQILIERGELSTDELDDDLECSEVFVHTEKENFAECIRATVDDASDREYEEEIEEMEEDFDDWDDEDDESLNTDSYRDANLDYLASMGYDVSQMR